MLSGDWLQLTFCGMASLLVSLPHIGTNLVLCSPFLGALGRLIPSALSAMSRMVIDMTKPGLCRLAALGISQLFPWLR